MGAQKANHTRVPTGGRFTAWFGSNTALGLRPADKPRLIGIRQVREIPVIVVNFEPR